MAIYGIGVDLIAIERIQASYVRFGERFVQRLLHSQEQESFPNVLSKKIIFLAKRFAAKEAVLKALGLGLRQGISWHHIKILHDPYGKPYIELEKQALLLAKQRAIETIHISISDEKQMAMAFAIAEGK